MVKRALTASDPARELAAKLEVITKAAPGLWRAGVQKVTDGAISFDLQEPPPVPQPPEVDDGTSDPYSVAGYRGKAPRGGGGS